MVDKWERDALEKQMNEDRMKYEKVKNLPKYYREDLDKQMREKN